MIDITELLKPVSAQQPCGVQLNIGDPSYLKLQHDVESEDKTASKWRDIEQQSVQVLKRSKDLQVILYLIRALIYTEGLAGFHAGLSLLHQTLANDWDTLYPELERDDDEPALRRANIIKELNDFGRVMNPLRSQVALVNDRQLGRFTLRDIEIATGQCKLPEGETKHDEAVIQAAFDQATDALRDTTLPLLTDCLTVISAIDTTFVAADVKGITKQVDVKGITKQVKDMQNACRRFCPQLEPVESEQEDDSLASTESIPTIKSRPVSGAIETRDDVVNALDKICAYYKQKEPSSPVPLLLERAKILVKADFNEIVQNLLPEAIKQLELIKGTSQPNK